MACRVCSSLTLLLSLLVGVLCVSTTVQQPPPITPTYQPINVVNQANVYELFYDLTNRVECDNYTDYYSQYGWPVVQAADDFVLPSYATLPTPNHMSSDCTALAFTFATIRWRQDLDPVSVTLQLFYNNASSNGPQNTPFFSRTTCAPNATTTTTNCGWDPRLRAVLNTTLVLTNGDLADDGVTRFSLSNQSLLPVGRRLWVSFFATVPMHYARNLLTSNSLFWMTLNNKTGSTPVLAQFATNGVANQHYRYRNRQKLYYNASQWVDATFIQPLLGVRTTTFNMAWRADLICAYIPPITDAPTNTQPPTAVPTTATTTTEAPTEEPTNEPTAETTAEPTTEPSTTAEPTTNANETNTTTVSPTAAVDTNGTVPWWYEKYMADRRTQIIVFSVLGTLFLLVLCVICCYCAKRRGWFRRKNKILVDEELDRSRQDEIELTNRTGYKDYNPLHHQQQDASTSASSHTADLKLTSRDFYTPVDLEATLTGDENDDHDQSVRDFLNNIVPTQPTYGNNSAPTNNNRSRKSKDD
jgi:hypothetical protein